MIKIRVTLANQGGDLDTKVLEIPEEDEILFGDAISIAIHEAIEDWVLSVGDIIAIRAAP